VEDLHALMDTPVYKHEKHLILGGGSNILLTGDFEGLVIKIDLKGIETVWEDESTIVLKAGAGEPWHSFVMFCVTNTYGGVENMSLIPGTIGAAPMQNIGAYGIEVKDRIKSVEAIDVNSGDVRVFSNRECEFGYRESVFKHTLKGKYFISSVTLTLTKKNHVLNTSYGAIQQTLDQHQTVPSIKSISDAVIAIRQQKLPDPKVVGNAGSFFKNPTIEQSHTTNHLKNISGNTRDILLKISTLKYLQVGSLNNAAGKEKRLITSVFIHTRRLCLLTMGMEQEKKSGR
jgi:UDP-N-acetylmuramate dehydrogenase